MNTLFLEETFDTATLANIWGTGLLQQDRELLWRVGGREISLRDNHSLLNMREQARLAADYPKAKQINRILAQLDFVRKSDVALHYPEMLQIEHTDICNARCIMCNHMFTRNHGCTFMDTSVIEGLEPYFPYVESIVLNGIGEPLLHPQINKIIETYDKYGIKMTTNTNLSIMNPELAQLIHKTFSDIQVSCDGAMAQTYENIRKGLKFDTFKSNLKTLRAAGDVEICMATVVMRQNIEELPQIVAFAADMGCDKVVMLDLNTSELLKTTQDSLLHYPAVASRYMELAREMAEKKKIHIHTLQYVDQLSGGHSYEAELARLRSMPRFRDESLNEELYRLYERIGFLNPVFPAEQTDYCTASDYACRGYCQFVESRPFISAGGEVFNCCTRRMHSMGSLKERSLPEIWNGPAMTKVRHLFNQGKLPKYCVGCSYFRGELMSDRLRVDGVDEKFHTDLYDELRMKLIKERMNHG